MYLHIRRLFLIGNIQIHLRVTNIFWFAIIASIVPSLFFPKDTQHLHETLIRCFHLEIPPKKCSIILADLIARISKEPITGVNKKISIRDKMLKQIRKNEDIKWKVER